MLIDWSSWTIEWPAACRVLGEDAAEDAGEEEPLLRSGPPAFLSRCAPAPAVPLNLVRLQIEQHVHYRQRNPLFRKAA